MNRHGFSLIELLITIALITIMLTVASFQFSAYSKKSGVESQTRRLYGDLMELRSKAMFEKRSRAVKLSALSYSIYSSEVTTVSPVQVTTLKAPIQWNNSSDIIFDSRGMLDTVDNSSICVSETNSAPVDSIVVSMTRIKLGKFKEGATGGCKSANIVSK